MSEHSEAGDWAALATLLTNDGNHEEAKSMVKRGIDAFPRKVDGFVKIGMAIVAATGDIEFRDELRKLRGEERQK